MRQLDEVLQSTPEGQKILNEGISQMEEGDSPDIPPSKNVCPHSTIYIHMYIVSNIHTYTAYIYQCTDILYNT